MGLKIKGVSKFAGFGLRGLNFSRGSLDSEGRKALALDSTNFAILPCLNSQFSKILLQQAVSILRR